MIRNRSFGDSIVPDDAKCGRGRYFITPTGYKCAFNNGEGWTVGVKGDRLNSRLVCIRRKGDIEIALDKSDTLNKNRRCSLAAAFKGKTENSIYNVGYSEYTFKTERNIISSCLQRQRKESKPWKFPLEADAGKRCMLLIHLKLIREV